MGFFFLDFVIYISVRVFGLCLLLTLFSMFFWICFDSHFGVGFALI